VLAWFILFQLLSVLMYGSLYIAIGAACTDTKEKQSLLMPVNLLMAIPLMTIMPIIQSPRGMLARAMTWFPPATPFVTVARIAVPPGISLLETLVSIVIVVITTIVLVWASGRIFRVGILMQGKGANLGQLVRWVVRG
jgi:ABC-type Na+ efflux pump permease subunit